MKKIKLYIFFLFIIINFETQADDFTFDEWKKKFKLIALERGVSLNTIENIIEKSIFLKDVIKYDRYQPEFYEDTKTYISKRANSKKVNSGLKIYKINKNVEYENLAKSNEWIQSQQGRNEKLYYNKQFTSQYTHIQTFTNNYKQYTQYIKQVADNNIPQYTK